MIVLRIILCCLGRLVSHHQLLSGQGESGLMHEVWRGHVLLTFADFEHIPEAVIPVPNDSIAPTQTRTMMAIPMISGGCSGFSIATATDILEVLHTDYLSWNSTREIFARRLAQLSVSHTLDVVHNLTPATACPSNSRYSTSPNSTFWCSNIVRPGCS